LKGIDRVEDCLTFSDLLRFHARRQSEKDLVYDGISGVTYCYSEMDVLVDKAVKYLYQNGASRGDIISIIINNQAEYLILFFATLRIGAVCNPFPYNLSDQNINKYLSYVEPTLVFCQNKHFGSLMQNDWPVHLIEDGNEGFIEHVRQLGIGNKEDFSPAGDEVACLHYSSGTTANPKGILYSHKNMIALISSVVRGFKFENSDCHLIGLPLGHTASFNYSLLPCIYCGARIILCESYWKIRSDLWRYIEEFNVSYLEVVPSVLFDILNTPYKDYDRRKLKRLDIIGCGSAPLPIGIQKKVEKKYGIRVANLYGLSETGPSHIDDPTLEEWEPGSIGVALDVNEVRIFDEDGNEVPIGEIGEIAIKGENVFVGYYKNEAGYKDVFKDGFFLTGDLGFVDKKGLYYFMERKKDLIIKGGANIYPGEIDEVLFQHPQVNEALTVGIEDYYLGEKIKCFIVLNEGASIDKNGMKIFCLQKLGDFKCPDEFVFVDDLPRGPSGKLLRRALKERV